MVSLSVLSKDDCKFSVLFEQIRNFKILNLAMAKVKKVNIAVTYNGSLKIVQQLWQSGRALASSSLGRGFKSRRENGENFFVRFAAETATSRHLGQFSADWLRLFFSSPVLKINHIFSSGRPSLFWRHDTRHNDIQHCDTQHSEIHHSKKIKTRHSALWQNIVMLSVLYADCHSC